MLNAVPGSSDDQQREVRASFPATLGLTFLLAASACGVVLALIMLAVSPTPYPPPLVGGQRQSAETTTYLIAFGLILPLALVAGPRLADRIARGPNGPSLQPLVGFLIGSLALAVLVVRLLGPLSLGSGVGALLAVIAIWGVAVSALLWRAGQSRAWRPLDAIAGADRIAWPLAGILLMGTLLALTPLSSISLAPLLVATAVAGVVVAVNARRRKLELPRWAGVSIDLVLAGLIFLAVPDLVIFQPELAAVDPSAAFQASITAFHQNFILGPANEVLAGGSVLVDAASQYGVASVYLVAGWSGLTSPGYGTFGLLDGLLTALTFVSGYAVLRISGCSRILAGSALALGVVILVLNLYFPIGSLPQQGPLRFGLPMLAILATVSGARRPKGRGLADAAAFAVLGLASIWAFEAFVYTLVTIAAMSAFRIWELDRMERVGWLLRWVAKAVISIVAVQVLFALFTLARAGVLPDWGQYLAFLHDFLFGHLGDLTYDFADWSPGLGVAAGYLASASALVLLLRRHRALVERERVIVLALCGVTAYGIALFSYFVDRSSTFLLPYIGLPALLAATLWLSLLLRSNVSVPRSARLGGLAFALAVAVLLLSTAWSSVDTRFSRSALAHATPGGSSLRDALKRLGDPPPLDARSPVGQQLLAHYEPGDGRALVLTAPDLETEILIRSERGSTLPLTDPWEDSFVADEHFSKLQDAIDDLRPGQLMLTDSATIKLIPGFRAETDAQVLADVQNPVGLAPLQTWALKKIDERFQLRPIHHGADGFVVVQLVARS